jgi:uncharacterized membrane protein YfcA
MLLIAIPIGVLIGILLGMVGSGGSLLGTPLLILVGGFSFYDASTSALFIVLTSSIGALVLRDKKDVSLRLIVWAVALGTLGTPLGVLTSHAVSNEQAKIILSCLLVGAGFMAWNGFGRAGMKGAIQNQQWLGAIAFVFVGFMTGLTGIGGGYLLVPALILIYGMGFAKAVTTSLIVVVFNALASILFRVAHGIDFSDYQWVGTGIVVASALVGSLLGSYFSKFLNKSLVQRVFSVLLFVLAAALVVRAFSG